MKARIKMIIVGITLVVLGCLLFVGCSSSDGFDWSKLNSEKFESKTYTTQETFQNISIDEDYGVKVKILPADDGVCKIEYENSKNVICDINVREGTLKIKQSDNRKWYHMIGFNFYTPTLTVYLPESELQTLNIDASTSDITIPASFSFQDLKIDLSTGDVTVSSNVTGEMNICVSTGNITVSNSAPASVSITSSTGDISASAIHATGDLYVKSSTGQQTFRDITCANATLISSTGDKSISTLTAFGNLTVQSNTGDASFDNVVCNELKVTTTTGQQTYADVSCGVTDLLADTGKIQMTNLVSSDLLKITTDTGDITFDNCDAASMKIKADTGDVTGTLRTSKIIYADTESGKVRVPHSAEGGLCEVTTSTGDIKLEFVGG